MTIATQPPVPLERRYLVATWCAAGAPSPSANDVRKTLELFGDRHTFTEMHSDYERTWKPYSLDGAVKAVMSKDRNVGLRVGDESVQASISRTKEDTFTVLTATANGLASMSLDEELTTVTQSLDQLSYARVVPDPAAMWVALRGHPRPPAPFAIQAWLHIVHPRWYESRTTRELLLAAPVRVEERDGAIWIWTYESPLHYDNDEAIESMKRLALYLRDHVRA